jgi:HSP20 family molecular chaperone IbpA
MQRDFFGTTLFNAMLPHRGAGDSGETARVPRLSMRDTGESIELTAELPGIKPENVSVELEGDVLTIRGEAEEHEERGDERMEHRACFYRQLALPEGVDPEQVHAAYENAGSRSSSPSAPTAATHDTSRSPRSSRASRAASPLGRRRKRPPENPAPPAAAGGARFRSSTVRAVCSPVRTRHVLHIGWVRVGWRNRTPEPGGVAGPRGRGVGTS